jgi:hypothetical protein
MSCDASTLTSAARRPEAHKKGTPDDSEEAFLSSKKNNQIKMDLAFPGIMPCSICCNCEMAPGGKEGIGKE